MTRIFVGNSLAKLCCIWVWVWVCRILHNSMFVYSNGRCWPVLICYSWSIWSFNTMLPGEMRFVDLFRMENTRVHKHTLWQKKTLLGWAFNMNLLKTKKTSMMTLSRCFRKTTCYTFIIMLFTIQKLSREKSAIKIKPKKCLRLIHHITSRIYLHPFTYSGKISWNQTKKRTPDFPYCQQKMVLNGNE